MTDSTYTQIDCAILRKLLFDECHFESAAQVERNMNITHSVLHKALGGRGYKESRYRMTSLNANSLIEYLSHKTGQHADVIRARLTVNDPNSPAPLNSEFEKEFFIKSWSSVSDSIDIATMAANNWLNSLEHSRNSSQSLNAGGIYNTKIPSNVIKASRYVPDLMKSLGAFNDRAADLSSSVVGFNRLILPSSSSLHILYLTRSIPGISDDDEIRNWMSDVAKSLKDLAQHYGLGEDAKIADLTGLEKYQADLEAKKFSVVRHMERLREVSTELEEQRDYFDVLFKKG